MRTFTMNAVSRRLTPVLATVMLLGGSGAAVAVEPATPMVGAHSTQDVASVQAQESRTVSPDPRPLLGKDRTDQAWTRYRQDHGCYLTDSPRWVCPDAQTSLLVKKGVFVKVWMNPKYEGPLPKGLKWTNSRTYVLKKLEKYPGEVITDYFIRWDLQDGTILSIDFGTKPPHRMTQVAVSLWPTL